MKYRVAYNADGTPALFIVRGIFRKRFYHVVPAVGLIELKEEKL